MRTLLIIVGFIISFAIVESLSAIMASFKGIQRGATVSERHLYDPYRGHRLNPDYRRDGDTFGKRIHSEDGFREDKPVANRKEPYTYRIIMMGGSAAYGIGSTSPYPFHASLRNNETIDYYTEGLINRELERNGQRIRVEIINAAVTAYITFQHLVYLNEILYMYRPNLVVFLEGHNDYYVTQSHLNPWLDYPYSSVQLANSFNQRSYIFSMYTVARSLSGFSYLMTLLEKGLQHVWEKQESHPIPVSMDALTLNAEDFDRNYESIAKDGFLRAYTQIKSLSDYYGFNLAFFLQPEVVFEDARVLSPQDIVLQRITEKLTNQNSELQSIPCAKFECFYQNCLIAETLANSTMWLRSPKRNTEQRSYILITAILRLREVRRLEKGYFL